MAKRFPVIDASGQFSRRRRGWIKQQEAEKNGEWREGIFVLKAIPAAPITNAMTCSPSAHRGPNTRAASLLGQLWAQPDRRAFPVDANFWDGRGVLRFWGDQSSAKSRRTMQ